MGLWHLDYPQERVDGEFYPVQTEYLIPFQNFDLFQIATTLFFDCKKTHKPKGEYKGL